MSPFPDDLLNVSKLRVTTGSLNSAKIDITSCTASELGRRIAARRHTSVQVITAFIKAATIAQDATNCLTEIFFDEGLKRASELDDRLERTGKTVGPLHGVAIRGKDHMDVKGDRRGEWVCRMVLQPDCERGTR